MSGPMSPSSRRKAALPPSIGTRRVLRVRNCRSIDIVMSTRLADSIPIPVIEPRNGVFLSAWVQLSWFVAYLRTPSTILFSACAGVSVARSTAAAAVSVRLNAILFPQTPESVRRPESPSHRLNTTAPLTSPKPNEALTT